MTLPLASGFRAVIVIEFATDSNHPSAQNSLRGREGQDPPLQKTLACPGKSGASRVPPPCGGVDKTGNGNGCVNCTPFVATQTFTFPDRYAKMGVHFYQSKKRTPVWLIFSLCGGIIVSQPSPKWKPKMQLFPQSGGSGPAPYNRSCLVGEGGGVATHTAGVSSRAKSRDLRSGKSVRSCRYVTACRS